MWSTVNTSSWLEHTLDFISVNTGQNFFTVQLQAWWLGTLHIWIHFQSLFFVSTQTLIQLFPLSLSTKRFWHAWEFLGPLHGIANATFPLQSSLPTVVGLRVIKKSCLQRLQVGFCICATHYVPVRENLQPRIAMHRCEKTATSRVLEI